MPYLCVVSSPRAAASRYAVAAAAVLAFGLNQPVRSLAENSDASSSSATTASGAADQVLTRYTFRNVAKKVSPAVVNIKIKSGIQFDRSGRLDSTPHLAPGMPLDDEMRNTLERLLERESPNWSQSDREGFRYSSSASGVIVRPDGYVVTSNHVIDKARDEDIEVSLPDGRSFDKVEVVGRDELTDLAVLKLADAKNLPALSFGNSDSVEVGDNVLAIGNPLEFNNSVSEGIVAAKHRSIKKAAIEDLIQTTAMINPGNSGGALVDLDGKLIGINMAIATSTGMWSGLGFAIPSKSVQNVTDQIIEKGKVARGYLGIEMDRLTAGFAQQQGYSQDFGIAVKNVTPGSAAEKAGLQRYDIIAKVDGKEIKEVYDMHRAIATRSVGDTVDLEVYRDNGTGKSEEKDLKVTLDERPSQEQIDAILNGKDTPPKTPGTKPAKSLLGMKVSPAPDGNGLIVDEVQSGSRAALAEIAAGDRLLQVNKQDVATEQDLQKALKARSDDSHLIYLEKKGGGSRFATVPAE